MLQHTPPHTPGKKLTSCLLEERAFVRVKEIIDEGKEEEGRRGEGVEREEYLRHPSPREAKKKSEKKARLVRLFACLACCLLLLSLFIA